MPDALANCDLAELDTDAAPGRQWVGELSAMPAAIEPWAYVWRWVEDRERECKRAQG